MSWEHLRMALRSIPPVPDRVPRAGGEEINIRLPGEMEERMGGETREELWQIIIIMVKILVKPVLVVSFCGHCRKSI